MGVGGQIWGPGPPKWIFFVFHFKWVTARNFFYTFAYWQIFGSPLIPEILNICFRVTFRENGDQKFWGRGTFSISPPCGAPFPRLTLGDFGPRDPDKKSFCSGWIAPHLGEIWILAGLHFGPLCLVKLPADFGNVKPIDSTYSLLSILRFKKKSEMRNSNKSRSKLEKTR